MSDLTDRLRVQPTASHFLKPAHLYQSLIEERSDAADLIDQQALVIRELVEVLTVANEHVHWNFDVAMPAGFHDRLKAAIAKALT